MRVVLQRVATARAGVDEQLSSRIGTGLRVLAGGEAGDGEAVLAVSQSTLFASTRKRS